MQQVILHIGMNKTGTSALQQFWNTNRNELSRYGVLYPQAGCLGQAHYDLSNALDFCYDPHPDADAQQQKRSNLKAALEAEIAAHRPRIVLFSSEFFTLPNDPNTVRLFFHGWDVRIIVYFRRHDAWWESAFAQATRSVPNPPWALGPESFVDWHRRNVSHVGDYRALLDCWAAVFGGANIIVRPYERQQNRPDLVADFMAAIGAEQVTASMNCVSKPVNESMPPQAVLLADLFQRLNVSAETKRRLVEYALNIRDPGPRVSLLSPMARRWLVDERMEDYAYIAKTFMNRADGRLFYDPLPDPATDWTPLEIGPQQVVEAALKANDIG